jgi:hypothetical protein
LGTSFARCFLAETKGFIDMVDRANVITYLVLLLQRMSELGQRRAKNAAEQTAIRAEAQALRERWNACMRELNPIDHTGLPESSLKVRYSPERPV